KPVLPLQGVAILNTRSNSQGGALGWHVAAPSGRDSRSATSKLETRHIRIVLHLEQPSNPSKLFPRAITPANVLQRLKQLVRSVDPHPQVSEIARPDSLPWSVS
ncbi:MAG: hypothetical protein ACLP53_08225, partial [Isosphaeraceae bacterium]